MRQIGPFILTLGLLVGGCTRPATDDGVDQGPLGQGGDSPDLTADNHPDFGPAGADVDMTTPPNNNPPDMTTPPNNNLVDFGSACVAETDQALCASLGKTCGTVQATDNCGHARTPTCGACTAPSVCGGGGIPNVCGGCVPETDQAYCARLGKSCDVVVSFDNCGASRSVNCGACTGHTTCGGGGIANVCGCTTETDAAFCARTNVTCGTSTGTDNCGVARTATCGSACACVPESDDAMCARYGYSCIAFTGNDNCGFYRAAYCHASCFPGICPGQGDGTGCPTMATGSGSMLSCLDGRCVPPRAVCYRVQGGTWSVAAQGTVGVGGTGGDSCTCTSPTHFAYRYSALPAANLDRDCQKCVELPGSRAVCF